MNFVNDLDVFLFYEDKKPVQVFLTAETVNKQFEKLLENDIKLFNDMNYLVEIIDKINENTPKESCEKIMDYYFSNLDIEKSDEFIQLFNDFGSIKKWEL